MAASSPSGRVWRRFRSNAAALAGSAYLAFCVLAALLGSLLAPDPTEDANMQVLELAKRGPGTRVLLLMQPLADPPPLSWTEAFAGQKARHIPIPLEPGASLRLEGGQLRYVRLGGLEEQLPLSQFGAEAMGEAEFRGQFLRPFTFWLGSDALGRDVLSRLLLGGRVSLAVGLMSVLISLLLGLGLGVSAGYFGGWVDRAGMWLVSVVWSLPTLLLALAISFALGKGLWQLFVAIGASMWVEVARLARGQILSLRTWQFAEAARVLGYRPFRIMFRHILPNMSGPLIVMAVANFGSAVLVESGLSFLGIGVEAPTPTWGRMVYEGYTYIVFENGKWLALFPGMALLLLIVSINLIGIGLRDALDLT
jgi:peptide/nickel transport system permease protein